MGMTAWAIGLATALAWLWLALRWPRGFAPLGAWRDPRRRPVACWRFAK